MVFLVHRGALCVFMKFRVPKSSNSLGERPRSRSRLRNASVCLARNATSFASHLQGGVNHRDLRPLDIRHPWQPVVAKGGLAARAESDDEWRIPST
ncbi:hypothetical protein MPTK1_5g05770 [Marchantia polymorpha subsp. ruderalis]|uniref:Uncharacterized protein n=1 Tax=Marchantia polymorpha subsp. ruderalis TaxID=1480154 RepID=A0AAF6BFC0_MARPO|nr:hypothetical protein Mp_5g05770 [Marchantia polymorpha subsp. ruderalis]